MTSAGSKTPISILNEYLTGRGYIPKFDLVVNGAGTHNPTFRYVVEYDDHLEVGEGRSKQEAKHKAARKMLDYLKILEEEDFKKDVRLMIPNECSLGYNAVGDLTDYCKRHFYPEPVFMDFDEAGPPHAKVFIAKCCVSQLLSYGQARTKKQAKQIAAHKMAILLKEEAGEEPMAVAVPNKVNVQNVSASGYPKPTPAFQPQSLLYSNYCNAYLGVADKSEKISKLLQDRSLITEENAIDFCKQIAQELVVPLLIHIAVDDNLISIDLSDTEPKDNTENDSENNSSSSNSSEDLILMTLELIPPIVSVGFCVTDAALNLIDIIMELCI